MVGFGESLANPAENLGGAQIVESQVAILFCIKFSDFLR